MEPGAAAVLLAYVFTRGELPPRGRRLVLWLGGRGGGLARLIEGLGGGDVRVYECRVRRRWARRDGTVVERVYTRYKVVVSGRLAADVSRHASISGVLDAVKRFPRLVAEVIALVGKTSERVARLLPRSAVRRLYALARRLGRTGLAMFKRVRPPRAYWLHRFMWPHVIEAYEECLSTGSAYCTTRVETWLLARCARRVPPYACIAAWMEGYPPP